jgi:L-rhamnose mutarotase
MRTPRLLRRTRRFLLGATIAMLVGCTGPPRHVERYGMVVKLKNDKIDEYKRLHAEPWPHVVEMIRECNIRNYSIYLAELEPDEYYLFGYFEYVGDDFNADMAKSAADEINQRWWKLTDPCQEPVYASKQGELWARMQEVFHVE